MFRKIFISSSFCLRFLKKKMNKYPHLFLLAVALFLRVYASVAVPLNAWDETEKVEFAKERISFDSGNFTLPLGDRRIANPLMSVYLVKLGFILFGENKAGGRLLFVLLGTLSLYFIYKLVKKRLGRTHGILVLALLTFSQFHIGTSRIIDEDCLLLFFSALSMYLFFKALYSQKKKWIYFTAAAIGIGYHGKELILLLPLVFFIFLLIEKKFRVWFRRKELYFAFSLTLLIMLPRLIWSINNNFYNYSYQQVGRFGLSLRSFYLYFGEVFAWVAEKFDFFIYDLFAEKLFIKFPGNNLIFFSQFDNEFPFVHWVLSIFVFIAVIYSFKKFKEANELIRFSSVMFGLIFVITSIVGAHSLFQDHWWASMTIYPGVILCSWILIKLKKRYRYFNLLLIGLIVYFIFHSFSFVNLPECQFAVPRKELIKYYLTRAEIHREEGRGEEAANIYRWIARNCREERIVKRTKQLLQYIN